MRAEMAEQPDALARVFARRESIGALVSGLRPVRGGGIILVARGSSDHAAVYARYVLELAIGCPVTLAAPSLFTRYAATTAYDGWVTLAFSQSGATPEIVDTVAALIARGARAIAVTNEALSPLAEIADATLDLECGPERAVPATKTFTTSLAAVAALASVWGTVSWSRDDEARAVEAVRDVLAQEDDVETAAVASLSATGRTHLGRGISYPVALESSLKFRETNGLAAEAMSVADYLHGPVAATRSGTLVVGYAAAGPTAADVLDAVDEAAARGARTCVVAPRAVAAGRADVIATADGIAEPLAVLPMAVRAQQLALRAALHAGVDPDAPFGLSKVTLTS